MKKGVMFLLGFFLFGVFALPGKVCPNAHDRVVRDPVETAGVPDCHRAMPGNTADEGTPCETMVCCLVPDFTRGALSAVLVPGPELSGVVSLPVRSSLDVSPPLSNRTVFEAQAPPGPPGRFSLNASPRGPPLA
ncbi:MAG: hypothetical protein JNK54_05885 [Elusimicrobia bacterium]|nr:hypothetical protein [Elusimicrobiota bacterium]